MPFVKQLNKDFVIRDDHFELTPEYIKANSFKFKKITGTRLSSIIGKNKYTSPLKQWCCMTGLYTEPIDPTVAKLGMYVEPKVRDYVSNNLNIKFKDYVPSEVKWDVFKNIDDVFGGIPDGEPVDEDGNLDYASGKPMLEIKTSSIDAFVYKTEKGLLRMQKDEQGYPLIKEPGKKKLSWFGADGKLAISDEYKYQLGLYLYLRKVNTGMFAVCFLTKEDYLHPENFKIEDHEVYLRNLKITNFDVFEKQVIEPARTWYRRYIKDGISPTITEADKQWLKEVELLK
ncbi:MAG: MPN551 family DNA-binding protein [Mycoplasmoidaceae bacterium]